MNIEHEERPNILTRIFHKLKSLFVQADKSDQHVTDTEQERVDVTNNLQQEQE